MRKGSVRQESCPLVNSGLRRNNENRKQPQDEFFNDHQICGHRLKKVRWATILRVRITRNALKSTDFKVR